MRLFILTVIALASLVTLSKAYRLDGNLELTGDPSLELLKYLKRWMDVRDIDAQGNFHPVVVYPDYPVEDYDLGDPNYYPGEDYGLEETVIEDYDESPTNDDVYDLRNLSFLDKERLKSVGSIEELAQITGLPLLSGVEEEEESDTLGVFDAPATYDASRVFGAPGVFGALHNTPSKSKLKQLHTRGHRQKNTKNKKVTKRAVCEPEKVSVTLPSDEGFRVIPSCVRVKKCGGCCNPDFVCVPVKTNKLELTVLELALNNTLVQYKVINDVTEDVECGCQCSVREEHCLPTQDYNNDNCSCFCKPELEIVRQECEADGRPWDTYRCTCQCPLGGPHSDDDCGTGQVFNLSTCRCENE